MDELPETYTVKPAMPTDDIMFYYTFKSVDDRGGTIDPNAKLQQCEVYGDTPDPTLVRMVTQLFDCSDARLRLGDVNVTSKASIADLKKIKRLVDSTFKELTADQVIFHKIFKAESSSPQVEYMSTIVEVEAVLEILGEPDTVLLSVHAEDAGYNTETLLVPCEVWDAGWTAAAGFIHEALQRAV